VANKAKQQRGIKSVTARIYAKEASPRAQLLSQGAKNKKKGDKRGVLGGI